jgi:hypothetical protein
MGKKSFLACIRLSLPPVRDESVSCARCKLLAMIQGVALAYLSLNVWVLSVVSTQCDNHVTPALECERVNY